MEISNIHNDDIYGVFIELGCGLPVSSKLLNVSGSSKTVYMSECPYSKEYVDSKYGTSNHRSVSYQRVKDIMYYYGSIMYSGKINTIYVSSFQVGDNNDISTHGWIGLAYEGEVKYYHISLHDSMSRIDYIERIGEIGIKLLSSKNKTIPNDCCVDIVLDSEFRFLHKDTLEFISKNSNDQISIFSSRGIDRLESITRDKNNLNIYKGSFNPLHNSHIEAANLSEEVSEKPIFSISVNTYQKGIQQIDSLIERIKFINENGYSVLVTNKPLFKENLDFIRNKFLGKVTFTMGIDTVERLVGFYNDVDEDFRNDFKDVKFIVINRDGQTDIPKFLLDNDGLFNFVGTGDDLSSTKIRNLIEDGDYESIKSLVPDNVYQSLKKDKKY